MAAAPPAAAVVVLTGTSTGSNSALPLINTAGALTINAPAGVTPGTLLLASISVRPTGMTRTAPSGWTLLYSANQTQGGFSTAPGGMTVLAYYRVAGTSEPASYTWTFANPLLGGGQAVGAILAFTGVDSAASPLDNGGAAFGTLATPSGLTHSTPSISTTTANTMLVASLSYLSGQVLGTPSGIAGITQQANVQASTLHTLQVSTVLRAATGATGAVSATAPTDADNGLTHLLALRPSTRDLSLSMVRGSSYLAGETASYTLTASNVGTSSEPGPLTIVNTLPIGLTYSSASGSGWSCSAAGRTVTCTRSSSLSAGATAPALTINASVPSPASGSWDNVASVYGTGGDAAMANNTVTDHYTMATLPYALYYLDEPSWGSVLDYSGNGRHATAMGSASPTGFTVPSPPGAALSGNPGTCGAGRVPAGTTAIGINTGINPASLGNSGSIAFWYAGSTAWNDGNHRMLFDASSDLATGDRLFFLAKRSTGALVFSVEDSTGKLSTATTSNRTFAANTWHHIAVTWDMAADLIEVYIDGVLAANSTTSTNGVLGSPATLYIGAQRMANVSGAPTGYTSNTANGYIDDVAIYSGPVSAATVAALMAARHGCVNHYQLSVPSTGLACLAATVTVTACADTSSPCTNPVTTLAGQTVSLTSSAGALAAGTIALNGSGVASTSFSHPAAADGAAVSITLAGQSVPGTAADQCCPNGSGCSVASSCTITLNTAGLIVAAAANGAATTVATQTAGSSSATQVLRAVRTNTSTKACESALTGTTSVNWAYTCNNPATCSSGNRMTLTGAAAATTIAANPNGTPTSWLPVSMSFDANGNAPFTFNYADVGQVTLHATKPAGGSLLTALSGSSNAFVVRPAGFTVSGIRCSSYAAGECATGAIASPGNNPAAASAAGTAFMPAGRAFTATVTAVDALGTATPNYGRESPAEGVTLAATLVAPAGGTAPALLNPGAFGAFSNGAATGTTFSYPEVGIITLTPSVADGSYLGTGNLTGTASGNVGRFTPHHFDLAVSHACSAGSFTYGGQPFSASIVARNGLATPTTTANYQASGSFAKAVTLSDAGPLGLGSLGGASVAATAFSGGVATASPRYDFTAKQTGPQTLVLRATDSDGISSSGWVEGSTALRSGRLRLSSAFGQARSALQVPVTAEYWSGQAWVVNSADGCTTVPAASLALSNPRDATGAASAATTTGSAVTLSAGRGVLTLAAPSPAGASVSWELALNLGSTANDQSCLANHPVTTGAGLPWLRSRFGNCAATWDRDPSARASFGIFTPESRKVIHQRELF